MDTVVNSSPITITMHLFIRHYSKLILYRLRTIEPITRLQQEFITFSSSAIGDLSESIKRLEKARADYRAALLWMKDVSEKLHNPDAREQLARFREVQ